MNDLRIAFRALRHNPAFAMTAVVSIGLVVGAAATVFAFYDGLLFRPMPVPRASEVVMLSTRTPSGSAGGVSFLDYLDFRRENHSFQGLFASRVAGFGFARDKNDQARLEGGLLVSGNMLDVLEIRPEMGRAFRTEEDQVPGRDAVAMVSHKFWEEEFGRDRNIAGRHVLLNGIDFTVIGVMPESFSGIDQFFHPSFYVPVAMAPVIVKGQSDILTDRAYRGFDVRGRLKPGVTLAEANGEAQAIAHSLAHSYAKADEGFRAVVRTTLQARLEEDTGDAEISQIIFALVGLVVLIACANVANLILSRGRARARELAIRMAIGASRVRVVRALLAECVLIALGASVFGLGMAEGGIRLLSRIQIPGDLSLHLDVYVDYRVICFTLAVALGSVLLFGVTPAMQMTRGDLVPALKAGDLDPSRRRFLGRSALVTAQVAGSLVLMVLMSQAWQGVSFLLSHNPGFAIENRLLMGLNPANIGYTGEQSAAFFKEMKEKVRVLPGVKSVALAHFIPTGTNYESETVRPEGYQFPAGQEGDLIGAATVDENYFATIGTPIVAGRGFLATDESKAPLVVVVNQYFVKHYQLKNPIGARVQIGEKEPKWAQIVGVAAMAKYGSVFEPPNTDFIYLPMSQQPPISMTLITETKGEPSAVAGPIREVVRGLAPNLPVYGVRTFHDLYDQRSVQVANAMLTVLGALATIGFGLALVGLYAVMAYQVTRRTREIGIRMAIGASKGEVMKMVLRQAVWLAGVGAAVGLALSLAASQGLTAVLQVPHFDLMLLAGVVGSLLLVAMGAALIPARRAALIDPMVAMRQD